MNTDQSRQRAEAITKDILDNHLPRVVEGLKAGYVDENQILVIYDHAVRARILKEAVPLPQMADEDWEGLSCLLYGAWEDSGLLQEEETRLAQMRLQPDEYSAGAISRVAERVEWMNDFYQRVILPRHSP